MTENKIKLSKPKVILFDWDDTLVDTGKMYKELLSQVIQELGIKDWNKEAADTYRYHSRRDSLPHVFGDRWQEVSDGFAKKIKEVGLEKVVPLPNALENIKKLLEDGVMLSIVSNKDGNNLREEVKFLGWSHYFHKIIGATDASRDKPWPDPVELALKDIDIKKEDSIWFLGDSIVDMQCANATRCTPMLFGEKDSQIHTKIQYLRIDYIHVKDHDDLAQQYKRI